MNNQMPLNCSRTFAEPAPYNNYIAKHPETLPEDSFTVRSNIDHFEVLRCQLSRSEAMISILANSCDTELGLQSSPEQLSDYLWQVIGVLRQAKTVLEHFGDDCRNCRQCDRHTLDGILSKLVRNDASSKGFSVAVQFLMSIQGEVGVSAKALFAQTQDLEQLKTELIALLKSKEVQS